MIASWFHPRRWLPIAAVALGCSVRDEQPAAPRAAHWWPAAARGQIADSMGDAAPGQSTGDAIEYVEGYEAGARLARDAQRPMLIVFRANWCPWSAEFMRAAAADRRAVELARTFVCVAVDADRDATACRQFGVAAYPTVVLVDARRRERFRATGSLAATGLAAAMHELVASGSTRIAADDPGAVR